MRILVCSTDYPPGAGGIARLSWASACGLRRLGHEVMVLASAHDMAAAARFDAGCDFPTRRIPARLGWREWHLYFALWKAIRDFKPDVLWNALWFPGGVLASYCPAMRGVVHVVSSYGSEILPNPRGGLRQWAKAQLNPLRTRVFRTCDWLFPLSRFTRDEIIKIGAPPDKMEVLPGGVDDHWFSIPPAPKTPDSPVLLTVARLEEHKGHDVVLRALPRLVQEFPKLRYRIVGPSLGNWERLEAIARENNVRQHVEYLGKVDEATLHRLYAETDLFVMPSREIPGRQVEGFGLTFLEAAAVGVPSIGGRSGGVPDAIEDGYSGVLVEPTSSVELAEAAGRLLRDRDSLTRLGLQARERAQKNFSWDAVTAQMSRRFEQLLAAR